MSAPDADSDAERAHVAALRHAANKRRVHPVTLELLTRSGRRNAAWLEWYTALRPCVDGKKDDVADALCQGYYHLRDKLWDARKTAQRAAAAAVKASKVAVAAARARARVCAQQARADPALHATAPAPHTCDPKGSTSEPTATAPVPVPALAPQALTAVSVDLGFRNLAFAVLRVFFDADCVTDELLRGVNFEVLRWQRVDCAQLAGVSGVNINATHMARLTEILMCGVATYADELFGTTPVDCATLLPHGRPDFFLLEVQKGGGGGAGRAFGTNSKTYAASFVLQACCLLHYAAKQRTSSPVVEFVSSAKKLQDAGALALGLAAAPVPGLAAAPVPATATATAPVRKRRASKGLAERIKPVSATAPPDAGMRSDAVDNAAASVPTSAAAAAVAAAAASGDAANPWRAPFVVGTVGLAWRKGQHPDPVQRAAAAARAAKKARRAAAATTADEEF